jgi:hypothetical protein
MAPAACLPLATWDRIGEVLQTAAGMPKGVSEHEPDLTLGANNKKLETISSEPARTATEEARGMQAQAVEAPKSVNRLL